eukprot:TRINITY_DN13647_c0_g1_i4.p1 TRINITY_DN13647_c0_g1~~TRINITY_DN13647_c0_g1_i4.p1  ORF type:complete len:292 (-),score=16.47 TRINITY_DN13647_c0_g1_i4:252-1127(-)
MHETEFLDLNRSDIIFPHILSSLSVEDWFNLRCVSREFYNLIHEFLSCNRRIDLSKTRKYSENVFKILTNGCRTLRYLDISGSKIATDQLIRNLVKSNPNLSYINLSNCHHLTSGILQTITIRNRRLERLILQDCHWVTRESMDYHAYHQGLGGTNEIKSPLVELILTGCWELTDDILEKLVLNFPKLKVLRVGKIYSLTDKTAVAISECLRNIEVLDLSGCWRITDSGLQLISEYCPKIRQLYVDECRGITEKSLKRFRDRKVKIDRALDEATLKLERMRLGFKHDLPAI